MIINLTPHAIHVFPADTPDIVADSPSLVVIPPVSEPARCRQIDQPAGSIEVGLMTVPLIRSSFGATTGLPEPDFDTCYVVSLIVAQANPDRPDLLVVARTVRDTAGRIVGCRAFATLADA